MATSFVELPTAPSEQSAEESMLTLLRVVELDILVVIVFAALAPIGRLSMNLEESPWVIVKADDRLQLRFIFEAS